MSALKDRVTWVWLALLAVTFGSWMLGGSGDATFATAASILMLSFFKVRLIVTHFMEVREAPLGLRLACDAWIALTLAALLWTYA